MTRPHLIFIYNQSKVSLFVTFFFGQNNSIKKSVKMRKHEIQNSESNLVNELQAKHKVVQKVVV